MATLKKSHKYNRSAIDLPTTEPCLDFYGSDCDEYLENRVCLTKNNFKIQSRGDQRSRTSEKSIPDELIITSAQKIDSDVENENKNNLNTEIKKQFTNAVVSGLPALRGSKSLNNSAWFNMRK